MAVLYKRENSDKDSGLGLNTTHLLVALISLLSLALVLVTTLLLIRRYRRNNAISTVQINAKASGSDESLAYYSEKQALMSPSARSPDCVPEIRITFPDEDPKTGKRATVVLVQVGDGSVGYRPVEEDLPPYQSANGQRFASVDLERVGGLKEKC